MKKKINTKKSTSDNIYQPIEISFNSVQPLRFSLSEPMNDILEDFIPEKMEIKYRFEFFYSLENNIIEVIIFLRYDYDKYKNNVLLKSYNLIELIYKYGYNVSDLNKLDMSSDKELIDYIFEVIASVSFSTSRGILLEKTQGSFLQKFILPIVSQSSVLNQNNIKITELINSKAPKSKKNK